MRAVAFRLLANAHSETCGFRVDRGNNLRVHARDSNRAQELRPVTEPHTEKVRINEKIDVGRWKVDSDRDELVVRVLAAEKRVHRHVPHSCTPAAHGANRHHVRVIARPHISTLGNDFVHRADPARRRQNQAWTAVRTHERVADADITRVYGAPIVQQHGNIRPETLPTARDDHAAQVRDVDALLEHDRANDHVDVATLEPFDACGASLGAVGAVHELDAQPGALETGYEVATVRDGLHEDERGLRGLHGGGCDEVVALRRPDDTLAVDAAVPDCGDILFARDELDARPRENASLDQPFSLDAVDDRAQRADREQRATVATVERRAGDADAPVAVRRVHRDRQQRLGRDDVRLVDDDALNGVQEGPRARALRPDRLEGRARDALLVPRTLEDETCLLARSETEPLSGLLHELATMNEEEPPARDGARERAEDLRLARAGGVPQDAARAREDCVDSLALVVAQPRQVCVRVGLARTPPRVRPLRANAVLLRDPGNHRQEAGRERARDVLEEVVFPCEPSEAGLHGQVLSEPPPFLGRGRGNPRGDVSEADVHATSGNIFARRG